MSDSVAQTPGRGTEGIDATTGGYAFSRHHSEMSLGGDSHR